MKKVKPNLQVVNEKDIKRISVKWLSDKEIPLGDGNRYYHPDCNIYIKGGDSIDVGYNIMLALQDCHMPVKALRRIKKERR